MTPSPLPPGPIDDTNRWTRSARTLWRRVPDGVLVLALPDGDPELVTGPGGDLWDLLDSPRTVGDLASLLASRYAHDPDIVAADLRRTLADLAARGVVVDRS